jgi:hypothetical protein
LNLLSRRLALKQLVSHRVLAGRVSLYLVTEISAMSHPAIWIESVRFASFLACAIGLYVLHNDASTQKEFGESNWNLMSFCFGYWALNCVAHAVQQWICPDCTNVWMSVKFTGLFSLLLTFSCLLSLPLNQIATKNRVES